MTEKQTQPSAIAQAAAEEYVEMNHPMAHAPDFYDCVYCREKPRLAALIDKHIAPLTQWKTQGIIELSLVNPNVASYIEHWEGRTLTAEATVRSQAEEIERLKKLIDRAHTEFVYISEAPTFELCKSTEMYELIDLLKPQP